MELIRPHGAGFSHAGSRRCYLAGGAIKADSIRNMRLVTEKGELTELSPMSMSRAFFPMAYQEQKRRLITVGGRRRENTDEVEAYNSEKNTWSGLPFLPEAIAGSAAALFGEENLYNIGGRGGSFSVLHLNVECPSNWRAIQLEGADFRGWYYREATVLCGKIIYFGS